MFEIVGLRKDGELFKNVTETQWIFEDGDFRKNSEYLSVNNKITDAYILTIMDCSKSFGDQFNPAKKTINDIINEITKK